MTAHRNRWLGPLLGWAALLILFALTAFALWAITRESIDDESTLDEKQ